jgi:hypothetical protein
MCQAERFGVDSWPQVGLRFAESEECAPVPQSEVSGVSRTLAELVAATSWADVAAQQH